MRYICFQGDIAFLSFDSDVDLKVGDFLMEDDPSNETEYEVKRRVFRASDNGSASEVWLIVDEVKKSTYNLEGVR